MPTKFGEVLDRAAVPDSTRARVAFLEQAAEAALPAPPDQQRPEPSARRRWLIALSAVAAGAAAVLIAVAAIPGGDEAPSGPLAGLAATAYGQQPPGPFEYVDWRYDFASDRAIDRRIETWAGAEERFERRSFSVAGRPAGDDATYVDRDGGVSCEGSAGKPPSCSEFVVGQGLSAAALWFEAPQLPTDPDELAAVLEEEIATDYEAGIAVQTPTTGSADGVSGFGPTGPFEDLRGDIREAILSKGLFSKLVAVVSNPYASPELRGAAYEVMGGIDGVSVREGVTDDRGRPASRITFVPSDPFRERTVTGESYELYVDPATALVLQLDADPRGGSDVVETVIRRRTVAELPPAAEALRIAASEFVPPPEPVELPPPEPGPPVRLASGPGWDLAITDDRAIVLTYDGGESSTSGFANPPTLGEFDSYRAEGSSRKLLAGPVLNEADSVVIRLKDGNSLEAELIDAFGVRWASAELSGKDRVASITVRDADGAVIARRVGRRVVGE